MKIDHRISIFSIFSIISVIADLLLLMPGAVAQQGEKETNIESPQFLAILHAQ